MFDHVRFRKKIGPGDWKKVLCKMPETNADLIKKLKRKTTIYLSGFIQLEGAFYPLLASWTFNLRLLSMGCISLIFAYFYFIRNFPTKNINFFFYKCFLFIYLLIIIKTWDTPTDSIEYPIFPDKITINYDLFRLILLNELCSLDKGQKYV